MKMEDHGWVHGAFEMILNKNQRPHQSFLPTQNIMVVIVVADLVGLKNRELVVK